MICGQLSAALLIAEWTFNYEICEAWENQKRKILGAKLEQNSAAAVSDIPARRTGVGHTPWPHDPWAQARASRALKASSFSGAEHFPPDQNLHESVRFLTAKTKMQGSERIIFSEAKQRSSNVLMYSIHSEKQPDTSYCNDKNNAQAWLLNIF